MSSDHFRKAKIVCTIGPAVSEETALEQLIVSGMNVARLNFSHGSHDEHAAYIQAIRRIAGRLGRAAAILQDLPGPKIRTGLLQRPQVELRQGQDFTLTTETVPGDEHRVSMTLPNLPQDVKPGDVISLNDGEIKLQVLSTSDTDVNTRVEIGGTLGPEKGINVPGVTLSVPSVTEEDFKHLAFGLEQGVDLVALSFVREASDVARVREFVRRKGSDVPLIAKIEKAEALRNIDAILAEADGAMVARGDLGVEIPIEQVPLAQKEIVRKCNRLGKPVIIATQMLESMINSPSPTRAEVADVANAILDGADAVMLSAETAIGRYPVEAVQMMVKVAGVAEESLPYEAMLRERGESLERKIYDAISYDACHSAYQLGAAAIVAFTTSGSTARRVAKYRPKAPIIALTPDETTFRRLALSWGVRAYLERLPHTADEMFDLAAAKVKEIGLAQPGDVIAITAGAPIGVPGNTNLLKLQRIH